jgi:radical SAM protein with 4Fe4S-binding SPASM domain
MDIRDTIESCQIDLTKNCNLTCSFCRQTNEADLPDSMSFHQWSSVITQLKEMDCKMLALAGGEPLMHKDFFSILSLATDTIEEVYVLSNGTLINQKVATQLAEKKIKGLQISLDAFNPALHDKIRGKSGTWEKATRGIKYAIDAGTPVTIRTTVYRENSPEATSLLEFAHDIGASIYAIRRVVPTGRGGSVDLLKPDELRSLFSSLASRAKELNMRLSLGDPFSRSLLKEQSFIEGKVGGCSIGLNIMYIAQDGAVLLCPCLPVYCGDVKQASVKSIWKDAKAFSIARSLRSNLQGKCGICKFKFQCGGCRASAYFLTGSICGEDSGCWYNP